MLWKHLTDSSFSYFRNAESSDHTAACVAVCRMARLHGVLREHPLEILLDVLQHAPAELRLHLWRDRGRRKTLHPALVTSYRLSVHPAFVDDLLDRLQVGVAVGRKDEQVPDREAHRADQEEDVKLQIDDRGKPGKHERGYELNQLVDAPLNPAPS